MVQESRTKKTLLNVRMNMLCYMASLVTAFFTRKILLDNLGTEFIGLTGTLGGLLGFLNLAELGVGSAIAYVLYKPIFDKDRPKINEIVSVLGYLYRIIGLVIFSAGIVLSLFLPLIFPDTGISLGAIYVGFYAYLASSMIGYFVNYRASLLSADQRNYIITGYFQISTTTKVIVQMVAALLWTNFYLYFAIEFTFGIINSTILNWKIRQTYPWLCAEVKEGHHLLKKYPEVVRYIKQLFVHQIGTFVQGQLTPLLIYAYVSLPMVALYENYNLITGRIGSFIGGIINSTGAGIGNLISEGNKEKTYNTFKEIFALRFFVATVIVSCVYKLINPFIAIWLGREYSMSNLIVILVIIQQFFGIIRGVYDEFIHGYGLFYDVWAPIAESCIFVVVAMTAGSLWGLPGVLLGPIVSKLLIVQVWKPYFLYSKGFQLPFYRFAILVVSHLVPAIIAYLCATHIMALVYDITMDGSWMHWIIGAAIFTIIMSVCAFLLFYIASSGLRMFIKRVRSRMFKI